MYACLGPCFIMATEKHGPPANGKIPLTRNTCLLCCGVCPFKNIKSTGETDASGLTFTGDGGGYATTGTLTAFDPKTKRATYDVQNVNAAKRHSSSETLTVDFETKKRIYDVPMHKRKFTWVGK